MDIESRRQRLDEAACLQGKAGVHWFGDMGDTCPRCGVQVPAGYQLSLPDSDVSGCLRCLELQGHMAVRGHDNLPDDLLGTVNQQHALRQVAEQFRLHIRAAERGRPRPVSRERSRERWQAANGEFDEADQTSEFEPFSSSRWPKREFRQRQKPEPRRKHSRTTPRPPGPLADALEQLGLAGAPSREEILAAFRQSAMICHPDYGGTAEAFRAIVEARDRLLSDS